jgi:predicted transcriptional regulator
MPAKPYRELRQKMLPDTQARAKAKADKLIAEIELEMNLRKIREKIGLSQEETAQRLNVKQGQVSKIERTRNITLNSLKRYISALGGELEINVLLPDNTIETVLRSHKAQ